MLDFRKQLLTLSDVDQASLDNYLRLVLTPLAPGVDYIEKHHILPVCLFPKCKTAKTNLVVLRGQDHLLAHYWLCKTLPRCPKMARAFLLMCGRDTMPLTQTLKHGRRLSKEGPLPLTMDQLQAYEGARILWAEYSKTKVTVKHRVTGKHIQIPKEQYDPEVHAHLTEGMTTVKTKSGGYAMVPCDHPEVISGELQHVNKGMFNVIDNSSGGLIRISSKEFYENPNSYTSPHKGKVIEVPPNKGKTNVLDPDGNYFWLYKDDPKLIEGLKSGYFSRPFKGKLTVRDQDGNSFNVDIDDPRLQSGGVFPTSKGNATVRDINGKVFQVAKDDPRIKSGELISQMTGRGRYIEVSTGIKCRPLPTDPRIANGELVPEPPKQDLRIRINAFTHDGIRKMVWHTDPRLLTGELVLRKAAAAKLKLAQSQKPTSALLS